MRADNDQATADTATAPSTYGRANICLETDVQEPQTEQGQEAFSVGTNKKECGHRFPPGNRRLDKEFIIKILSLNHKFNPRLSKNEKGF
ncbi:MAG: hypothetical protein PHQ75_03215 [Thermoguttaceae bacterium]|nr:hypothetical protein [Thermoguttaceae bacterium]